MDTHLHLSALMTSPELFAYLNEIYQRDGHKRFDADESIADVLLAAGFEPGKTAIDDLRTQSTSDMYRDFDAFNAAFTPFRSKKLADMLFKTSVLDGAYLKEIVKRMADKAAKHSVRGTPVTPVTSITYMTGKAAKYVLSARKWLSCRTLVVVVVVVTQWQARLPSAACSRDSPPGATLLSSWHVIIAWSPRTLRATHCAHRRSTVPTSPLLDHPPPTHTPPTHCLPTAYPQRPPQLRADLPRATCLDLRAEVQRVE